MFQVFRCSCCTFFILCFICVVPFQYADCDIWDISDLLYCYAYNSLDQIYIVHHVQNCKHANTFLLPSCEVRYDVRDVRFALLFTPICFVPSSCFIYLEAVNGRRTDNTMAKRKKIDNTMAKRKKTDNTMAKRKKTDNTMAKRKKTNRDLQNTTQKTKD